MPTSDLLAGFILKKEACATYARSFRQLARDFDKADARGDKAFLENFRLHLEDGTIMETSEVTKEKIQKLRDKGLNPTWYVRESWMRQRYGLRSDDQRRESTPLPNLDPEEGESPALRPTGPQPEIIKSKDDLIQVLREELHFLRESLSTGRARSSEDKQLIRELHILMKNMQDRLLPAPTSAESRGAVMVMQQPNRAEPAAPEPVMASSRPKPRPKKPAPKKEDVRAKWYELPTFKKLFRP